MTLDEFKGIFWWEYWHRLLGRLIGVAYLVPLLWFVARRRIPPGHAGKLFAIFLLGGLQGVLGWYMVKSGLVDDPRVSQFRLTAHLGLALGDLRRDVLGRAFARVSLVEQRRHRRRGARRERGRSA
jgi:cytochrome c oxidase assembly protein subunit 15